MVRKTTSLKVDDALWRKVKIHCINEGLDISEYIESLVEKDLKLTNKFIKKEAL